MDKVKQTHILMENVRNFLSGNIYEQEEENSKESESIQFQRYILKNSKKNPDEKFTYVMLCRRNPEEGTSKNELATKLVRSVGKEEEILGNVVFSLPKNISNDLPQDMEDTILYAEGEFGERNILNKVIVALKASPDGFIVTYNKITTGKIFNPDKDKIGSINTKEDLFKALKVDTTFGVAMESILLSELR